MWKNNPSVGRRGKGKKRNFEDGPKRRNKVFVTVDSVLSKALSFIEKSDPSGTNSTLCYFASTVRSCQASMNEALVTLDEARLFADAYADFYIGLANGVLIPPHADVFFEGYWINHEKQCYFSYTNLIIAW